VIEFQSKDAFMRIWQVYKNIAVVWTPFYTTRDGKMATRGTNIITMLKGGEEGKSVGGWRGRGRLVKFLTRVYRVLRARQHQVALKES
jgi:hypothetical protein